MSATTPAPALVTEGLGTWSRSSWWRRASSVSSGGRPSSRGRSRPARTAWRGRSRSPAGAGFPGSSASSAPAPSCCPPSSPGWSPGGAGPSSARHSTGSPRASSTCEGSFPPEAVDALGHALGQGGRIDLKVIAGRCPPPTFVNPRGSLDSCLQRLGVHVVSTIQPVSRYWSFQLIESAIFAALTVLLVAFTVRWVRHRIV